MTHHLPPLDLATLQLTYQLLALLFTAFSVAGAVLAKGRYGLWFWAGCFATLALLQILAQAVLPEWSRHAGYLSGHIGGMLSSLCVLLGIRAYLGLVSYWKQGLALVLTAGSVCALLMAVGLTPRMSLAFSLAVSALLRWQAFSHLLAAFRRQGGTPMGFATVIILLSVISHLVRTGALLSPLGAGYENGFQSNAFGMLGLIVVLVTHGFVILLLVTHALQREVLALAEHDSLTGLLNRRGMDARFERLRRRAAMPGGNAMSLALIDVDHFKAINDRLGHGAGDDVLRGLGLLLDTLIRPTDLAVRLGGEEFVLLWNGVQPGMEGAMAEKIRLAVSKHPFETREGTVAVTVSIGVTGMPAGDGDLESVLKRADRALYRAKQDGRDRVVVDAG